MPNTQLIPALAKMLLAIAWADDELHPEEEATLKEVVGLLPSMNAQEWALIELYLVQPVGAAEREELLQNLVRQVRSAEDKRISLEAVAAMQAADGTTHPAEEALAQRVVSVVGALDTSPIGQLGRMIGGATRSAPRREAGLQLWRANPVLHLLQASGAAGTDEPLAVAALAAGIMAQVVRFTPRQPERTRPLIVAALSADWAAGPAAERMADAALALGGRNVDFHRIGRELSRRSTDEQRVALLDTLFAIANVADNVAPDEIDEIRIIADRLNLTRAQFVAAKLKVPSAQRGGL